MDEQRATDTDETPPVSPAEALSIIEREQARREPDIGPYFVLWGLVWLVIGLSWFGVGRNVIGETAANVTTLVLVVGGMLVSLLIGRQIARGVSGPSSRRGRMYFGCWLVAIVLTGAMVGGLSRFGGPGAAVLAPALFVFVVGVLYTAGGVFWNGTTDYVLGIVVQLVAVLSVFTEPPWNSLVMGVLGGGALIVAGGYRTARARR